MFFVKITRFDSPRDNDVEFGDGGAPPQLRGLSTRFSSRYQMENLRSKNLAISFQV